MNVKHRSVWRSLAATLPGLSMVAAILVFGAAGAAAGAPCRYTVTEIEPPAGQTSVLPFGGNNHGDVVGDAYSNPATVDGDVAFGWAEPFGSVIIPGLPGAAYSLAFAVNDKAQVVGQSIFDDWNVLPWISYRGVTTPLPLRPGDVSGDAWGINEKGTSVGDVTAADGTTDAVYWYEAKLFRLPALTNANWTRASAPNKKGNIAGFSGMCPGQCYYPDDAGYWTHAVLWKQAVPIDLGTLGGHIAFGWDVNEKDQVVGSSTLDDGTTVHAFLWDKGVMRDLDVIGTDFSEAYSINERGVVVGNATMEGESHAVVWARDGRMLDLNELVDIDPGFVLGFAQHINERGQIVVAGVDFLEPRRAALLTPVGNCP